MKITDIVDEHSNIHTTLSGRMYMEYNDDDWPNHIDDGYFSFYCGPENELGYLSDCAFINDYLLRLMKELEISLDVDIAENVHAVLVDTKAEAIEVYNKLYLRIKQDFEIK